MSLVNFKLQKRNDPILESNFLSLFLLRTGFYIISILFLDFVFVEILLLLKSDFLWIALPLSFLVNVIGLSVFLLKKYSLREFSLTLILIHLFLITAVFFFTLISKNFYDVSFDGQTYHQQEIISLRDLWNPYYEGIPEETNKILIDHYPKAPAFIENSFYYFSPNIEYTKSALLTLTFGSFLFFLGTILQIKKLNKYAAFLISIFIFVNPILLGQVLTFMNDYISFSLLVALATSIILINYKKSILCIVPFAAILGLVCNFKFTNIIYASLIIVLGLFGVLLSQKRIFRKLFVISAITLFFSVFIFGFFPYFTNLKSTGNLFYPVQGDTNIDPVHDNVPGNLIKVNPVQRFFYALFSKSIMAVSSDPNEHIAELKIPFSVDQKEIDAFKNTNIRAGGFGPWFGGIFLISVLGFIYYFYKNKKDQKVGWRLFALLSVSSILILIATIAHPVNTLARFVPLLWLIPLLFVFLLLLSDFKYSKIIAGVILAMILINNIFVGIGTFTYQFKTNEDLQIQLQKLKDENKKINITTIWMISSKNRIEESGTDAEFVKGNCKKREYLIGTYNQTVICEN